MLQWATLPVDIVAVKAPENAVKCIRPVQSLSMYMRAGGVCQTPALTSPIYHKRNAALVGTGRIRIPTIQ